MQTQAAISRVFRMLLHFIVVVHRYHSTGHNEHAFVQPVLRNKLPIRLGNPYHLSESYFKSVEVIKSHDETSVYSFECMQLYIT